MNINRIKFHQLSIFFFLSITVAFIYVSGIRGFTSFDESIIYNYGWNIFNSKINGLDYVSPLMPLSGLIVSLGYAVFGVNYLSAVYITTILSAVLFLFIYLLLDKGVIKNKYEVSLWPMLFIISTLGPWGIPYYNSLSNLFVIIFGLLVLKDSNRYNFLLIAVTMLLIIINKLNAGIIIYIGYCTYFLFTLISSLRNKNLINHSKDKIIILVVLFFLIIYLLMYKKIELDVGVNIKFNIDAFLKSFRPSNITSEPSLNLLFVLFLGGLLVFSDKYAIKVKVAFAVVFLGHVATYAISADTRVVDLPILLFLLYIFVYYEKLSESNSARGIVFSIIAVIFIFFLGYSLQGTRKINSETTSSGYETGQFVKFTNPRNNFFDGLYLRTINQEFLQEVCNNIPQSEKIFFGPGLEIFYPATNNFQPFSWPIWIHPGISYNPVHHTNMENNFADGHYDFLVMSKYRASLGFTKFLDIFIENNYHTIFKGDYILIYKNNKL